MVYGDATSRKGANMNNGKKVASPYVTAFCAGMVCVLVVIGIAALTLRDNEVATERLNETTTTEAVEATTSTTSTTTSTTSTTVPVTLSADDMEEAFLLTVHGEYPVTNGAEDYVLIDYGHSWCDLLNAYQSVDGAYVSFITIAVDSGLDVEMASFIAGASTFAFCPEWGDRVNAYAETMS